jgi:arginyl-tRNA--protein-N-Asp/Glu arginylyltransferase
MMINDWETSLKGYMTRQIGSCAIIPDRTFQRELLSNFNLASKSVGSTDLNLRGFRKMVNGFARAACVSCQSCKPARVLANEFTPNKTQRKIIRSNQDLTVTFPVKPDIKFHYALYDKFMNDRGFASKLSLDEFGQFTVDHDFPVRIIEARDKAGTLVAGTVYEEIKDGTAGAFFYYPAELSRRRLGTFMVLQLLDHTKRSGKPYCYMGPWTDEQSPLSYKSNFQPLEILDPKSGWRRWVPEDRKPAPAPS